MFLFFKSLLMRYETNHEIFISTLIRRWWLSESWLSLSENSASECKNTSSFSYFSEAMKFSTQLVENRKRSLFFYHDNNSREGNHAQHLRIRAKAVFCLKQVVFTLAEFTVSKPEANGACDNWFVVGNEKGKIYTIAYFYK